MRFFRITYTERGKARDKYIMLERPPTSGNPIESILAFEIDCPFKKHGGIYGGTNCVYGFSLPEKCRNNRSVYSRFC